VPKLREYTHVQLLTAAHQVASCGRPCMPAAAWKPVVSRIPVVTRSSVFSSPRQPSLAVPSPSTKCSLVPNLHARQPSWFLFHDRRLFGWRVGSRTRIPENEEMSQGEEDAAKAAILNKVMQGRPSDLMLRCNVSPSRNVIVLTGFVSQALYLMLMVNNFRKVEHTTS
jgi:hypothetical protein